MDTDVMGLSDFWGTNLDELPLQEESWIYHYQLIGNTLCCLVTDCMNLQEWIKYVLSVVTKNYTKKLQARGKLLIYLILNFLLNLCMYR